MADKGRLHYLAYGSNLHPLRLTQRVPSARLLDTIRLKGYQLHFNKRGRDSSAKCNLVPSKKAQDHSFTALYQIDKRHKMLLDQVEGCGQGYQDVELEIEYRSTKISCFTYFAQQSHLDTTLQPYHWYKNLVVHGARYLDFPSSYIQSFCNVASITDPDTDRNRTMQQLIMQIKDFSPEKHQQNRSGLWQ